MTRSNLRPFPPTLRWLVATSMVRGDRTGARMERITDGMMLRGRGSQTRSRCGSLRQLKRTTVTSLMSRQETLFQARLLAGQLDEGLLELSRRSTATLVTSVRFLQRSMLQGLYFQPCGSHTTTVSRPYPMATLLS